MTTEKTLTNEQIARVFAMYWGDNILIVDLKKKYKVDYETLRSFFLTGDSFKEQYRLLLTPLSAITDEDAIEAIKIFHLHIGYNLTTERAKKYLFVFKEKPNSNSYLKDAITCQYLIQKGYAVPLFIEVGHPDNGKTAIELGLAIDKTKY